MPTIHETCTCGATLHYQADWATQVDRVTEGFREAHEDCRRTPTVELTSTAVFEEPLSNRVVRAINELTTRGSTRFTLGGTTHEVRAVLVWDDVPAITIDNLRLLLAMDPIDQVSHG